MRLFFLSFFFSVQQLVCYATPRCRLLGNGCVNKWGTAITLKTNGQSFVFISQDTFRWLFDSYASDFFLVFFAFLFSRNQCQDRTVFTCPSQSEQQDLVKTEICRIRGVIAGGHGRNWKYAKLCCPRKLTGVQIKAKLRSFLAVAKGSICIQIKQSNEILKSALQQETSR